MAYHSIIIDDLQSDRWPFLIFLDTIGFNAATHPLNNQRDRAQKCDHNFFNQYH